MIDPSSIKAFGEWILVEVEKSPEKSKGGIYLPQGNLEESLGYSVGKVKSVGQGRFNKGKAALLIQFHIVKIKENSASGY